MKWLKMRSGGMRSLRNSDVDLDDDSDEFWVICLILLFPPFCTSLMLLSSRVLEFLVWAATRSDRLSLALQNTDRPLRIDWVIRWSVAVNVDRLSSKDNVDDDGSVVLPGDDFSTPSRETEESSAAAIDALDVWTSSWLMSKGAFPPRSRSRRLIESPFSVMSWSWLCSSSSGAPRSASVLSPMILFLHFLLLTRWWWKRVSWQYLLALLLICSATTQFIQLFFHSVIGIWFHTILEDKK